MPILSKKVLLNRIVEAVHQCNWNVLYISTKHPFRLNVFREEMNHRIKIYIWNLTHGGGSARPGNEYRIQVKVREDFEEEAGWTTLILGWWEDVGVFAGFDLRKHYGLPGWSSSIQIKKEALQNAYINGFAATDKGNQETAMAFRPDFFIHYLQNLASLHDFGQSSTDLETLNAISANPEINEQDIPVTNRERKTAVVTLRKKLRDVSFRKRVLTAYNSRCAICGMQLSLVEASHIVPVHENGTEETANGLALCALHHKAYDNSIITVLEDYSIKLSDTKVSQLEENGLDGGLEEFKNSLRPIIHLPPAIPDRPHIEYIKLANQIRAWS